MVHVIAKHRDVSGFRLILIKVLVPFPCHSVKSAFVSHVTASSTVWLPPHVVSVPTFARLTSYKGAFLLQSTNQKSYSNTHLLTVTVIKTLPCTNWIRPEFHSPQRAQNYAFKFKQTGSVLEPGGEVTQTKLLLQKMVGEKELLEKFTTKRSINLTI